MIGIYNRFCRKCNENNCKQRKNEHFFCWNAIIYNIRNLPFNMLSLHRKLPQKDADECRHVSDSPDIGRKIQQPHSSRVQPIFSVVPAWSAAYPFFAIVSHEKKSIPSAMHFLHMRSASECAASHRWSERCLRCGRAWRSDRD